MKRNEDESLDSESDFDQWAKKVSGEVVHSVAIHIGTEGGISYSEAMAIITLTCCRLMSQSLGQGPFTELENVDRLHEEGCARLKEWFDERTVNMMRESVEKKEERF